MLIFLEELKMSISKILCVVVVICVASSLNAAVVVDDFESYALNTNLDGGGGGWSPDPSWQANLLSPIVKDGSVTAYPEISGQFLLIDDDNSYANSVEVFQKDLGVALDSDGDYLQTAMYLPAGGAGTANYKLLDASGANMGTAGMTFRQFVTPNGYTPLRPSYDTWYYLRTTVRDADIDGVVDSWDFEVFDTSMTLYTGHYGMSTNGLTSGAQIQFASMGTSGAGIVLVDEITAVPEPTTIALLGMGCLAALRRRRK
jgi:hypothetical protein